MTTRHFLRTLTLVTALMASGAAFAAAAKQDNAAAADCANRAAMQFSIDTAQCSGYPTYSGAYGNCMVNATQKYSQAIVACGQSSTKSAGARTFTPAAGGRPTLSLGN